VKLGEALGIPSWRAESEQDVDTVVENLFKVKNGPALVEFRVVKEDMVFPMVPSGASISDMIVKRLNPKRMV
jgi:acetolactate synthase-1/2/3 large subunit